MSTWWSRRKLLRLHAARVLVLDALGCPLTAYQVSCGVPMRMRWIYRALDDLLAEGAIVDSWRSTDPGRPPRRFYAVNDDPDAGLLEASLTTETTASTGNIMNQVTLETDLHTNTSVPINTNPDFSFDAFGLSENLDITGEYTVHVWGEDSPDAEVDRIFLDGDEIPESIRPHLRGRDALAAFLGAGK